MIFRGFCVALVSIALLGCQTTKTNNPVAAAPTTPAASKPRDISITMLPAGAVCDPQAELMFQPTWPKSDAVMVLKPDEVRYAAVRILRLTCNAPGYRESVRFLRSEQGSDGSRANAFAAVGFFAMLAVPGAGGGTIVNQALSYRFPPEVSISMVPESGATPAQIGAERQAISEGIEAWRELRLEMCKGEGSPTDGGLSAGCERDLDRIKKSETELLVRIDGW
jgi:hypothetical protein